MFGGDWRRAGLNPETPELPHWRPLRKGVEHSFAGVTRVPWEVQPATLPAPVRSPNRTLTIHRCDRGRPTVERLTVS